MKYYNLIFIAIVFSLSSLQDEFVEFKAEETEIKKSRIDYKIKLSFNILKDYYIQAETGVPENIIPTQVSFEKNDLYEITGHKFSSEGKRTIFLDTIAHKVLSNRFELAVFLKLKKEDWNEVKKLKGEILYQACNNMQCFYPRNLDFEVEFI